MVAYLGVRTGIAAILRLGPDERGRCIGAPAMAAGTGFHAAEGEGNLVQQRLAHDLLLESPVAAVYRDDPREPRGGHVVGKGLDELGDQDPRTVR